MRCRRGQVRASAIEWLGRGPSVSACGGGRSNKERADKISISSDFSFISAIAVFVVALKLF
jgi:hypothetical protein